MSNKEIVLDIQNLTVQFHIDNEVIEAVNDVSLQLEKGKTLGLVGETGAGKTTTAKAVMRLIPQPPGVIKDGKINVCGHDMLNLDKKTLSQIRGHDLPGAPDRPEPGADRR